MIRLAWITDPHFNFLDIEAVHAFCAQLAETQADGFLIAGDIGEAPNVVDYLGILDTHLKRPIYFVLGNHDFYRGRISGVREQILASRDARPNLIWMPAAGIVPLTETACLIGHDGWADGRHGNFATSDVRLSDWRLIQDLAGRNRDELLAQLRRLGDTAADHFRAVLPDALERFEEIFVLTHVPPFREGCTWQGRITSDNWLPHLCCKAVGDVLMDAMADRPDRTMTVLCGHTHQPADALVAPNLRVITGAAEYYQPRLQSVLKVAGSSGIS